MITQIDMARLADLIPLARDASDDDIATTLRAAYWRGITDKTLDCIAQYQSREQEPASG
jgi:hypothetical protein